MWTGFSEVTKMVPVVTCQVTILGELEGTRYAPVKAMGEASSGDASRACCLESALADKPINAQTLSFCTLSQVHHNTAPNMSYSFGIVYMAGKQVGKGPKSFENFATLTQSSLMLCPGLLLLSEQTALLTESSLIQRN
jgi:hypothetical protein